MTATARMVAAVLGTIVIASAASANDWRHGRVLEAEYGVVIQRATEASSDQAFPNMPFLPGDRVWTTGTGRAEFQFGDGTIVRLDGRSKLDYVAFDEAGGRDARVVLRLWSGSAFVQTRYVEGRPDVGIETPSAVIESRERSLYRVDVEATETRLAVHEGEAEIVAGRGERVRGGEMAWVRRGGEPEQARRFDVARADDFDRWSEQRDGYSAWADTDSEYLPDELDPYGAELDPYGRWIEEPEVGWVWAPVVASSWQPYSHGRWVWTVYGWTWVPNERWGWVTSHYGRWGHSHRHGWYWIPSSGWGPGWVSWAIRDDYVGWSPLGHRDRPVHIIREHGFRDRQHKGNAVPRGSTAAWTWASREQLGSARPVTPVNDRFVAGLERDARLLDGATARPDRNFRAAAPASVSRAVPRNVSTRPGPGDTVPELRTDPLTQIPFPVARRRAQDRDEDRDRNPAVAPGPAAERRARPLSPGARTAPAPAPSVRRAPETSSAPVAWRAAEEEKAQPRPRSEESDRDVLRRIFRPADRAEERERPRPRVEERERPRPRSVPEARPQRPRDDGDRGARPRSSSKPPLMHVKPPSSDEDGSRKARPRKKDE